MSRNHSASRIKIKHELAIILGLSFILILTIYVWPEPVTRITVGLLYSFFFPGYTLLAFLFPKGDDLGSTERTLLSFGISIVVVSLIGLLLNYTPWGIRLESILIAVTSFILFCSGVAYFRRSRLSVEDRFVIRFEFDVSHWQSMERLDRFLSVMLALSIVAAIGALIYAIAKPKIGERFTEFYILGPSGIAGEYPEEIIVNEPIILIFGVVNHEHSDAQYRIEMIGGGDTKQIESLWLGHEEIWEQPYALTLTEPGENRKITFLLYKGDEQEPYRSLHLWITTKEASLDSN
jgi:uncharacterized membrane protein